MNSSDQIVRIRTAPERGSGSMGAARSSKGAVPARVVGKKTRYLKSPISYPGGKRKVVEELWRAMPQDWTEFREPFVGGGAVSLYLMQRYPDRKFWINDLDPFVSEFWKVLATNPEELVRTLNHYLLEFPSDKDKVCLAEWAKTLINETEGVERAAMFFVMSKTSYSGLAFVGTCAHPWRFNAAAVEDLLSVGRLLTTVDLKVTDLDYSDCLSDDPNVFLYFDPPYLIESNIYGQNGNIHRSFDHGRFAQTVNPLKSRWMVSYNDDLLIRHHFRAKHVSEIEIQYVLAEKRKQRELLITNYENQKQQ